MPPASTSASPGSRGEGKGVAPDQKVLPGAAAWQEGVPADPVLHGGAVCSGGCDLAAELRLHAIPLQEDVCRLGHG